MKKIFIYIALMFLGGTWAGLSQNNKHRTTVKLNKVSEGTVNDSILSWGSDKKINYILKSDLLSELSSSGPSFSALNGLSFNSITGELELGGSDLSKDVAIGLSRNSFMIEDAQGGGTYRFFISDSFASLNVTSGLVLESGAFANINTNTLNLNLRSRLKVESSSLTDPTEINHLGAGNIVLNYPDIPEGGDNINYLGTNSLKAWRYNANTPDAVINVVHDNDITPKKYVDDKFLENPEVNSQSYTFTDEGVTINMTCMKTRNIVSIEITSVSGTSLDDGGTFDFYGNIDPIYAPTNFSKFMTVTDNENQVTKKLVVDTFGSVRFNTENGDIFGAGFYGLISYIVE